MLALKAGSASLDLHVRVTVRIRVIWVSIVRVSRVGVRVRLKG